MYIEFLLVLMVLVAAITDLRSRRIPNLLVGSGILVALLLKTVFASELPSFLATAGDWQSWLMGMLVGFGLFFPFYLLRGMGAGDVKLMAAVGSFVGPLFAFKIALATFIIGGIWSLGVILAKRKVKDAWINLSALLMPMLMPGGIARHARMDALPRPSVGRLPYGVAIALGTISILYFARG